MRKVTMLLLMGVFLVSMLQADFTRTGFVDMKNSLTDNTGGIGNMVAGVDVDGDGELEIYMVNDNWNDAAAEETVPKIYKYETDTNGDYQLVWEATVDTSLIDYQNSWPTLSLTDLDNDGKMELTWGVVNGGSKLNPARIVVYEHAAGDNFGVDNAGSWEPNSSWTITDLTGQNIRPVNWEIVDFDNDGVDEILFASRKSSMRFGVCSVDDIPDTGDGSETWTLEFSSEDPGITYAGDNKWDVAVIGSNAYFFDEVEISKVSWTGSAYTYTSLAPLKGGISFDAVQVADIDGDGTEEMITGEYSYGDGSRHLWLLEEDGDTLKHTALFDINAEAYLNGGRLIGGDHGDIDGDGNMDFVFGSRFSGPPNAMIFRFEYQGGDMTLPENWQLTIADSDFGVVDTSLGGVWNVITIANVDDDEELEILYTSSTSVGYSADFPTTSVSAPVIILDGMGTTSINEREVAIATDYRLEQNYPNPFNPSTTITFHVPQNEIASLKVYDMTGREVATLMHRHLNAGSYDVNWSGLDNNGNQVATGLYIYTLQTASYTNSKRMVLIK